MAIALEQQLTLICSRCHAQINESEAYLFGGPLAFACEKCVRKEYGAPHWRALAAELRLPANYHEEVELKGRRYNAQKALKSKANRRILEKQAEERTRYQ
jgi:hypothetical protein